MSLKTALYAFKEAIVSPKIKNWWGKEANGPAPSTPPPGKAKIVKPVDLPPKPPV